MTTVAECGFSILLEIFKMIYLSIRPLKDRGEGLLRLKRGGGRKGFKSSLSPLSLRNTRPSPAVHSLISAYLGLNFNPGFFSIYSKTFP